jgi:hypothetical protein
MVREAISKIEWPRTATGNGIMAGDLAIAALSGRQSSTQAEYFYNRWMHRWFNDDASRMRRIYPSLAGSDAKGMMH